MCVKTNGHLCTMSGETFQTAVSLYVVSEACAVHGHMTCRCADHPKRTATWRYFRFKLCAIEQKHLK